MVTLAHGMAVPRGGRGVRVVLLTRGTEHHLHVLLVQAGTERPPGQRAFRGRALGAGCGAASTDNRAARPCPSASSCVGRGRGWYVAHVVEQREEDAAEHELPQLRRKPRPMRLEQAKQHVQRGAADHQALVFDQRRQRRQQRPPQRGVRDAVGERAGFGHRGVDLQRSRL